MGQDERRKGKTKRLSVSPLFHVPRKSDLISVWRSAAVTVTSFPARPRPVKIRGPGSCDLDIWLFFQQTEGIQVPASFPSRYLSTPQMCFCVWYFWVFLSEDLRHVLSSMSLLLCCSRENESLVDKRCAFKNIPAGSVGLCTCMCTHSSVFVHSGADE